jgi:hypothetical protein
MGRARFACACAERATVSAFDPDMIGVALRFVGDFVQARLVSAYPLPLCAKSLARVGELFSALNLNHLFPSLSPSRRRRILNAFGRLFGRLLPLKLKLVQSAQRGVDRVVYVVNDLEAALDLLRVAGDESKLGFYRLEGFGFCGHCICPLLYSMFLFPDKDILPSQ